jgi:hypothetical protein
MNAPKVGQHVVYHDGEDKQHDALVMRADVDGIINIAYIHDSVDCKLGFGREVVKQSGVFHKNELISMDGPYWRFPNELPRGD